MTGARTAVHAAHEKARLLVLMETVDCGPTVSTAYDYYGKENKNDGRTSEASGLTTRPPNRVRLRLRHSTRSGHRYLL